METFLVRDQLHTTIAHLRHVKRPVEIPQNLAISASPVMASLLPPPAVTVRQVPAAPLQIDSARSGIDALGDSTDLQSGPPVRTTMETSDDSDDSVWMQLTDGSNSANVAETDVPQSEAFPLYM